MPIEVVLDASVTAKWQLADEEHADRAEVIRLAVEAGDLRLVVPQIWLFETASIFSKAVANRRLPEDEGRASVEDLILLPEVVINSPHPIEAYSLARRFNRSVYDCFYLTIAEERGCTFWTDDRKLARALSPRHSFVRWIGDYPDPATPTPA